MGPTPLAKRGRRHYIPVPPATGAAGLGAFSWNGGAADSPPEVGFDGASVLLAPAPAALGCIIALVWSGVGPDCDGGAVVVAAAGLPPIAGVIGLGEF